MPLLTANKYQFSTRSKSDPKYWVSNTRSPRINVGFLTATNLKPTGQISMSDRRHGKPKYGQVTIWRQHCYGMCWAPPIKQRNYRCHGPRTPPNPHRQMPTSRRANEDEKNCHYSGPKQTEPGFSDFCWRKSRKRREGIVRKTCALRPTGNSSLLCAERVALCSHALGRNHV